MVSNAGSEPPASDQIDDSHRIAAIAAAAEAFSRAVPDIDALLAIVAEQISRATGDFCSVVLLSPDGARIEPVAAYHPDARVLHDAGAFLGIPMELNAAGPWKTVLQERRPIESFLIEIPDRCTCHSLGVTSGGIMDILQKGVDARLTDEKVCKTKE